jgi:electron transport complex protein RnfD
MVAFAAISGAVLSEFLLNFKLRVQTVLDGSAAASALVFSLLLPNTFPPVLAFFGAIFAMAVVKYSFGGLGANWINPAVGAWLFVRFSWPGAFEGALENSPLAALSMLSGQGETDPHGSPLSLLVLNGVDLSRTFSSPDSAALSSAIGSWGESITAFLNRTIFSSLGAQLPGEYMTLFVPRFPAIIADRGFFCLLIGTIVITAFQVSRAWIPVVFLAVYALLVRVFGAVLLGGALGNGDVLFGICSGGIIAAAFLVTSDPATAPKSRTGIALAAVLAAVLTFVFRYLGFEPYGAFFATALINVLVPLIREIESRGLYRNGVTHE